MAGTHPTARVLVVSPQGAAEAELQPTWLQVRVSMWGQQMSAGGRRSSTCHAMGPWGGSRGCGCGCSQVAGRQRRTPLIKEWRDSMTEVGDNQSLVASLKQSSYYNMFKDEVGRGAARDGSEGGGRGL